MRKITLSSKLALGDHVCLEMCVHSLHIQYPKEYQTSVIIPQADLFDNHPLITRNKGDEGIAMKYPGINTSSQIGRSFAEAYCDYLGEQLEIPLKLQVNRPHLYLTDIEKKKYKELGKYWIVICGGKQDFTAKHLSQQHLQEVVNHFVGDIAFVQPVKREHLHYPLKSVKVISNLNIRDMLSLVYNSSGVICPVTCFHHLAAAFEKPCICIGGGREPVSWVCQYPKQHYLHSIGTLDCCPRACWKSRVMPLGDDSKQDKSLCSKPVFLGEQWIPTCIAKIRPQEIISLMERMI